MSEFFGSVWWLIVTLGLLITFHEYGHYVVARRFGVKVLRFSIGFGRPLWSRTDRNGTEFTIAAIPLGGYVKMLDERESDDAVAPADLGAAFNRKPVLQRMAIAAAGPAFNLVFAIAAFWLMLVVGKPDFEPVVGTPTGLAAEAGIENGDRIDAVGEVTVDSWSKALQKLGENAIARLDTRLTVTTAAGAQAQRTLAFSRLPADLREDALYDRIGLALQPPPAVIGRLADGPAEAAGLRVGDRIVRINGHEVASFRDVETLIPAEAAKDPRLALVVQRGDERLDLAVTAEQREAGDGGKRYVIGIGAAPPRPALLKYGPLAAIPRALAETRDVTLGSLNMLKMLVVGQAGLDNLSGPISIARFANGSAQLGFAWFVQFLGIISLSLAIMNLLPIPILDGGHLVYYLIELVKGSPVSERVQVVGQYAGLVLLVALMGLAFYNDILRLVS